MNKLILLSALLIHSLTAAYGQAFEVRPFTELVSEIESTTFTYKETGLLAGFNSIQSCLYVAKDMVIFKNYCFPKRDYPARGFTILSAKFGMIDLYEEKFDAITKRDVLQNEFSKNLVPYLTTPFPQADLAELSGIMENLNGQYNPGCWSTNWSYYTHQPEAACSRAAGDVTGFNTWAQETQMVTGTDADWKVLFETIEKQLLR